MRSTTAGQDARRQSMALYLGLDSSTQSLSALIIDTEPGKIVGEYSVNFGEDLPQYGCPHGVLPHDDPLVQHSDPRLWAAALEHLFALMRADGAPLCRIRGISGSGQQHGTVYLGKPMEAILAAHASLPDAVASGLSRPTAPIWMDSSTTAECREIHAALGGEQTVRQRSGSSATERFSGPQIRRFAKTDPAGYRATRTIHLVSSFMASLLLGSDAPIDLADAAGMNLLNLQSGEWDADLLAATAPDLRAKLPALVPSTSIIGTLGPHLAERFGFASDVALVAWSGDNPNSLIGTGGWRPGTAVISLGTSDTFFAAMSTPAVDPQGYGHVFGNPAGGFMCLICFKNGSLAREHVKQIHGLTWRQFDIDAFEQTPPGNNGNLMLPYFAPEITPLVLEPGVHRRGSQEFVAGIDAAADVRALVEAQALSMRIHAEWIGECPKRLRVTGGASRSPGICQVLADVFDAPIERLAGSGNSAALGAALRAANRVGGHSWDDLTAMFCHCDPQRTAAPVPGRAAVYAALMERYRKLENEVLGRK